MHSLIVQVSSYQINKTVLITLCNHHVFEQEVRVQEILEYVQNNHDRVSSRNFDPPPSLSEFLSDILNCLDDNGDINPSHNPVEDLSSASSDENDIAMGGHKKKVDYLASLVNIAEKKVSKQKVADESKQQSRMWTYKYHLQIDENLISICKPCVQ
ncbi:hypothetical protein ILUMI_00858 [Ignelater luminosus]|uniref:Uncharacterized protein n=1 Tax=Ignelater luminosus TaxID=2038154 RepID=A0A8K0DGE4_IGNLU|nr:hypothetical protein ILUMI_00858 [Ignelater luminosus]